MKSSREFVSAIERRHGPQLRRFLSARMRRAAAEVPDLMQEIFLRLLRIKDHESIRNPQAYVYTVANHVLAQHALSGSVELSRMSPLEVVSELQAGTWAPDPAEEAETEQHIEGMSRALEASLPRAYAVFLLYRCEGCTFKEIAQRLGVTPTMARKYLIRALAFCDEYHRSRECK